MTQCCGSCGDSLGVRVLHDGSTLCWPCVKYAVIFMHKNGCLNNPLGLDLVRQAGQRVDTWNHHGFMIWGLDTVQGQYPWIYVDDSEFYH